MLTTAKIFQPGMVIQRDKPFIIWGTADAGAVVSVSIQGNSAAAAAGVDGTWRVILPALPAAESVELVVSTAEDHIRLSDIAIGEVWIAGGQSNMEFWMRYEKHYREGKETAYSRRIRFFDVPKIAYDGQEQDFDYSRMGCWRTAVPEHIEYFSAAGYYFAKELEKELDVPIGIIGCNWGGTSSCAWMSADSAQRVSKSWADKWQDPFSGIDMEEYRKNAGRNPSNNTGNPFAVPFNEFMLPRTPSQEEIDVFLADPDPAEAEFEGVPQPQTLPGSLYEHMVKSIAPYTVRGVLWYQGETDDMPGYQQLYSEMLAALAADWRGLWADEKLPFLIVQLPGWESWYGFVNEGFPIVRQCQQRAVDEDENMYLCSISDAGERLDIHPKDKKIVGKRLSLLALGHIYGEKILCDAPRISEVRRKGNVIVLRFANAEGGLKVIGERIDTLHISSVHSTVDFHSAIDGENIVITLPENIGNVQIDFAQTMWYRVNLFNQNGIPAIPFSLSC